jgi:hypothetical protein
MGVVHSRPIRLRLVGRPPHAGAGADADAVVAAAVPMRTVVVAVDGGAAVIVAVVVAGPSLTARPLRVVAAVAGADTMAAGVATEAHRAVGTLRRLQAPRTQLHRGDEAVGGVDAAVAAVGTCHLSAAVGGAGPRGRRTHPTSRSPSGLHRPRASWWFTTAATPPPCGRPCLPSSGSWRPTRTSRFPLTSMCTPPR